MPGDNVELVCELVHNVAAEVGTRFTLREGGKTGIYIPRCVFVSNIFFTVGTGIITKMLA
jgi:elongation factor Tu